MAQTQIINLDIFDKGKWLNMSIDDKKIQLQQLEDYYAIQQGRNKITLQYDVNCKSAGIFDPNNNSITLNESILNITGADLQKLHDEGIKKNDLSDFNKAHGEFTFQRYQLIDALIHEGKHADQYNVLQEIKNNHKNYPDADHLDLDPQKLQLWKENNAPGCYLEANIKGDAKNRYQALEIDSWDFSKKEMDKIFSPQSPREQKSYGSYRGIINENDIRLLEEARMSYKQLNPDGKITNPIAEIDAEVHQTYQMYTQNIAQNQGARTRIALSHSSLREEDIAVTSSKIGEIRSTLNSRMDELNIQQKEVHRERDAIAGAPLTKEQAEKLAASDYVKGADIKLDQQLSELQIKQDKLKIDEKSIMDYGKENGLDKTLWRYAPEVFKGEGLKYYESSIGIVANNTEVFDRQATEIQAKSEQLQERLNTPEARLEIAKKSEEYLAKDKERLAKLEPLDNKLSELKKEQTEIIQLKNSLPSRKSENEIKLDGDAKDVKNLLQQTSQIKQQMIDMQQTMGRGQNRSR